MPYMSRYVNIYFNRPTYIKLEESGAPQVETFPWRKCRNSSDRPGGLSHLRIYFGAGEGGIPNLLRMDLSLSAPS